jgi:hypothetical protein
MFLIVWRRGLKGTFYEPSVGACGQTNNANQLVVAISAAIFNNGALCGQVYSSLNPNTPVLTPFFSKFK